jgi:hypothetical protein
MAKPPFPGDWHTYEHDDRAALEQFSHLVSDLAGLVVHERKEGAVMVFVEPDGRVRHLVTWSREGWVCICLPFHETLSDCAATIVARMANATT